MKAKPKKITVVIRGCLIAVPVKSAKELTATEQRFIHQDWKHNRLLE